MYYAYVGIGYSYLLWAFYIQSREKCDEVTVHALEAPVPEQAIHTGLLHQLTVVIQTIIQQLQENKNIDQSYYNVNFVE